MQQIIYTPSSTIPSATNTTRIETIEDNYIWLGNRTTRMTVAVVQSYINEGWRRRI